MLKRVLSWVLLVVLVGYVVAAGIWARAEAKKNSCKGIQIEIARGKGADSISSHGVMMELRSYPGKIVGEQLFAINTREVEQYLKSYPQFEDINCSFTTDGRLKINVTPMIPELRIFEDSISYYINKDGKRMPSKASFFVDCAVAGGKFTDKFPPTYILPVTRFIEKDEILKGLVGMVYAEDADNIILIPRIHGHVINFGDTTRLKEKKEALLAMYRKVLPHKGWEEYDTISVKFKGQVVATRRNKGLRTQPKVEFEEPDMEDFTLPEIEKTENQNQ